MQLCGEAACGQFFLKGQSTPAHAHLPELAAALLQGLDLYIGRSHLAYRSFAG